MVALNVDSPSQPIWWDALHRNTFAKTEGHFGKLISPPKKVEKIFRHCQSTTWVMLFNLTAKFSKLVMVEK